MKKRNSNPEDAARLRQKAEEKLKARKDTRPCVSTEADKLKLLHELEVHQIELELQNEELVTAKENAEQAVEKYTELYDFAPSGYVSLTKEGDISILNFAAARMLGKERSNLINNRFAIFLSKNTRSVFDKFIEKAFTAKEKQTCEVIIETKANPEPEPIYVNIDCVVDQNDELCHLTVIDITERKQAEEEIKKQLTEKETLLREVHHHIKNNMANVKGLLSLQSRSTTNPEVKKALKDASSRVQSMHILYDKLLLSKDHREISIKYYIEDLIGSLQDFFIDTDKIIIETHISDFSILSKKATSIGIIINELLTNVFKYAFKDRKDGLVSISIEKNEKMVTVTIQDNGVGVDEKILENKSPGFGLTVVKMLVEQLDGTYSIKNDNGTKIVIQFEL